MPQINGGKVKRVTYVNSAWGLHREAYYQALSDVSSLSSNFSFDILQFESAQPGFQQVILQLGYLLSDDSNRCQDQENFPLLQRFNITVNECAILIGQIE
jgi:hypothetical protein